MTGRQFRKVDLDLLADYVGGALSGRPEELVVARLIADDPDWARAYEILTPAVHAVRDTLADWGSANLAMPDDVTARLTAAIAYAGDRGGDTPDNPNISAASRPHLPDQPRRRLAAVPNADPTPGRRESGGRPPGRPDTGRDAASKPYRPAVRVHRRWSRWAGPIAVAAAIVTIAGFGASELTGNDTAVDSAASVPNAEGNVPLLTSVPSGGTTQADQPSPERVLTSGTNYTRVTLAGTISSVKRAATSAKAPDADQTARPFVLSIEIPPGLDRLADRDALTACLGEVTKTHRRGPITVGLVDYASFESTPALVIAFVDQSGEHWGWVAGPRCGSAGFGADTRFRTRVG